MQTRDQARHHHQQLETNLDAFSRQLPHLLSGHEREFALLHDGQIVGFFTTAGGALTAGVTGYGKGEFSIQKIARSAANLGVHSYAWSAKRPHKG